jgi:hypothetical protein
MRCHDIEPPSSAVPSRRPASCAGFAFRPKPRSSLGGRDCAQLPALPFLQGPSSGLKDLGSGDGGACIAGGQHERTNSDDYALAVNKPQDPVAQDKWFVCVNCNLLFFGPFNGKCVKNPFRT